MKQKIFKHNSTNFLRNKQRNEVIMKKWKEKYNRKKAILDNSNNSPNSFFIDSDQIKL